VFQELLLLFFRFNRGNLTTRSAVQLLWKPVTKFGVGKATGVDPSDPRTNLTYFVGKFDRCAHVDRLDGNIGEKQSKRFLSLIIPYTPCTTQSTLQ